MNQSYELIGNRYQPETMLGQGGMGEVYRAVDRLTGRMVALKRVKSLTKDSSANMDNLNFRLALAREFKVLASLRHPNIINVLDYGFDSESQPYITMELLEEARDFLAAAEDDPLAERIDLLIQLLQALAYLHRRGILHRDLKPSNVLVEAEGGLKVLDFGLAIEPEKAEGLVGTLDYMAPEIIQGQQATPAADLYAVGVIAYQLFTGRHPFNNSNLQQLLDDVLHNVPDLSVLTSATIALNSLSLPAVSDAPAEAGEINEGKTIIGSDETAQIIADTAKKNREKDRETVQLDQAPAPIDTANLKINFDASLSMDDQAETLILPSEAGSSALAVIVGKLLSKTPQARYHNAVDLINDLAQAAGIPTPEESSAIRESFLQAAAFVGREHELNQLEDALNSTAEGKGSAWLVAGESGVGKSRLLEELRILALVRGILVMRGQAVTDGGLPLQMWREPLRRLVLNTDIDDLDASILKEIVPDIDDLLGRPIPSILPLEGKANLERLMGSITDLFQRQKQPAMLLLEDMQWAGESLEVLKPLTTMVGSLPILIVGNYRHEERPDLPNDLPDMKVLRLERLSSRSIADLSASMLGEAGRDPTVLELLRRETEGNVFFLVEVVRALAEEAGSLENIGRKQLPTHVLAGGIQKIIQRRLERVPEEGRRLLRLAAVYGRELDQSILEMVNAANDDIDLEDWLTTCVNSAVLEVQDARYRFAHDKLREATLAAIPASVRPSLHRQIAEAIETIYPNRVEQAAILAQHWRAAGEPTKEFGMLQQAGDYALHISALSEAVTYFERALELQPDIPLPKANRQPTSASLHIRLGEALQYTGAYEEADKHIAQALQIYRKLKDEYGTAYTLSIRGDMYWRSADYVHAAEACNESLQLYRQIEDQVGIARVLNRLGMIAFAQGDYALANQHITEALKTSEAANDQPTRAMSINNLGMVASRTGDFDTAVRYITENLAICQQSGERWKIASALTNLGTLSGIQGNLADAARYYEQALAMCRSIGDRRGVGLALENLGFVAQLQGQYEKATRYLEESLSITETIGNRSGSANTLLNLGHVATAVGDNPGARDLYLRSLQISREIEIPPLMLEALCGLARIEADDEKALAWLGLILQHPTISSETKEMATQALKRFSDNHTLEEIETLTAKGASLDLATVISGILQANDGATL